MEEHIHPAYRPLNCLGFKLILTDENWIVHPSSGCIIVCNFRIAFRVSGRAVAMTSLSLYAPLKQKQFSAHDTKKRIAVRYFKEGR